MRFGWTISMEFMFGHSHWDWIPLCTWVIRIIQPPLHRYTTPSGRTYSGVGTLMFYASQGSLGELNKWTRREGKNRDSADFRYCSQDHIIIYSSVLRPLSARQVLNTHNYRSGSGGEQPINKNVLPLVVEGSFSAFGYWTQKGWMRFVGSQEAGRGCN